MHIYPEFLALKIALSRLPYFYIIRHITTGAYYAGYKCRKPNSLMFLKPGGYQTSSRTVKDIIAREGLDSFRIIRIHHFETKEEAFEYETRFLKKVGVPYNQRFLNQHVTNNFCTSGKKHSEEAKAKMRGPRGPQRPLSEERKAKLRESKLGKKLSEEHKAKIRESNLNRQFSDEHKAKLRGPRRLRGPHSEETKSKMRITRLGKKHSNETKAKMKVSYQRRQYIILQST
jgi:hypothetical protein